MTGDFSNAGGHLNAPTRETIRKQISDAIPDVEYLGTFEIAAEELQRDERYQRLPAESAIKTIQGKWWKVSGHALCISKRADGSFFVVDGWHRREAAFRRDPQAKLICVVWRFASWRDEARAFLELNRMRKPMSSLSSVRALKELGDRAAIHVFDRIVRIDREAKEKSSGAYYVGCVGSLYRWAQKNPDIFDDVFDLYSAIAHGHAFSGDVFNGLCYLQERALAQQSSILDVDSCRRWKKLGATLLQSAIVGGVARAGKGGEKIYAWALQEVFNRGRKTGHRFDLVLP